MKLGTLNQMTPSSNHTYETVFLGANQAELEGIKSYNFYENYFIGNDSTKWANKVPIYKEVKY